MWKTLRVVTIIIINNEENCTQDNLDIAKKGDFKIETESLNSNKNNAIRTHCIKAKIGYTNKNSEDR